MAMLDNYEFLVNHIRNSFITSDETGLCELILESDVISSAAACTQPQLQSVSNTLGGGCDESDCELAHSLDVVFNMDLAGHRRRSNTAQRLEKLKLDKQKQSKIKHIHWKKTTHPVQECVEYFIKKSVASAVETNAKSALSKQIAEFDSSTRNPFMQFAKFDGRAGGNVSCKTIDIYLTMAGPSERSYPMTVVCLSTAKIHQLIGLICWQYTLEDRQPVLLVTNVDAYTLNMVEDDGSVDCDFPALDSREPVSKFGFNKLALVLNEQTALDSLAQTNTPRPLDRHVTVETSDGTVLQVSVDCDDVLMRDVLNKVLAMRDISTKTGHRYKLVVKDTGVVVDLDASLSSVNTTVLRLIRENSVWPSSSVSTATSDTGCLCQQYRSYDVEVVHKLRSSQPAQLGVSSEKIELNTSRSSRHSGIFTSNKPKSIILSIDDIAACTLHSAAPGGRHAVRMVYCTDGNWKHYDVLCDEATANDIVTQVGGLLSMRSSAAFHSFNNKLLSRRHTLRL